MWENGPSAEEDEVVNRGQSQVLAAIELHDVFEAKIALGLIETEQLVCAKEARDCGENLHHYIAADNDCEDELLEEALNDPRVDRLGAHKELCSDAELSKEVAEEFDSL